MRCDEARERLTANASAGTDEDLRAHLDACADCAAFARRLDATRTALRSHRSDFVPDPAFSARVVAALPGTTELLGWAAVRLLPAALVLALLCGWYGATRGAGLGDLLLHPDDPQLLTYVALGGHR